MNDETAFVPFVTPVQHAGVAPRQWLLVLHGIYGRGGNWRAFARKVVSKRQDWGVLLMDLRMHGRSQNAPKPHTIAACAQDVVHTLKAQKALGNNIACVLGHSFGGKVALQAHLALPSHHDTWVIDSSPSKKAFSEDNTVIAVLDMLRELPEEFEQREDVVQAIASRGFPRPLAQWLAMNFEFRDNAYRRTLDLDAIEALLLDYASSDLWDVVESRRDTRSLVFVAASHQSALSDGDRDRLKRAAEQNLITLHTLDGGHWLHVDALDALVDLVANHLS